MENINFPTPAASRVDASWRFRVQNPLGDQAMTHTYAAAIARPTHNSIALPTGVSSALFGRVAGAAEQAAPPRGIPR